MGIVSGFAPLPLIPESILRQHQVHELGDTRFRAVARLLQSLWRQEQGLAAGVHHTRRGGQRRLGSRLTSADAGKGRNFLAPALAQLARHELIYREHGALIEQRRLLGNLLSSQSLTFNLFGPLRLAPDLATTMVRQILPALDIAEVQHVGFEHSPGRRDPVYSNDGSAFDVVIAYRRSDGGRGLIAVEVKYAEGVDHAPPAGLAFYDDLAEASGLFKEPHSALLRLGGLQQLFREHLLAQAMLMRGGWDEVHFVLLAPRQNHQVVRAAELYGAHLTAPLPGIVPFVTIDLETTIDAFSRAGEADYAFAIHDRYASWYKVDALVAAALAENPPNWSLTPPRDGAALALVHG